MSEQGGDFGFCGPAYEAPMVLQDAQASINFYPEIAEIEGSKMAIALLGAPGLRSLITSIPAAVRGSWVLPGGQQALVVIGPNAYVASIASAATTASPATLQLSPVGQLLTQTGPVCIRDNGVQFGGEGGYAVIVDGQYGYYYTLTGQAYTQTFTGGLTNGSPTISVGVIPNGLVIGPSVTLKDSSGFIGLPTTLYSGSMTAGTQTYSQPATPIPGGSLVAANGGDHLGFSNGQQETAFGSYTTITPFPGGNTLVALSDLTLSPQSLLTIGGFSSDPGQDWLYSCGVDTTVLMGADAGYFYNAGYASWSWNSQFGFVAGSAYGINLTLNALSVDVGYSQIWGGSIAPTTIGPNTIFSLYQTAGNNAGLTLQISGANLGQTYFAALVLNDSTFYSSDAAFAYTSFSGGLNRWFWPSSSAGLVSGNTYPVQVTASSAGAFTLTGFDVNAVTLTMSGNAIGTNANDTITVTIPAFGQITDPGFLGADRIGFVEGWLLFNQPGTRTFFTTGPTPYQLLFPGTWFALKDSSTDNLVTLHENNREVWMIGERTSEVWFNDGNAPGVAFSRIPAVGPQIGCAAKHSISRINNNLIWLAANEQGQNIVVMQASYGWQRVSNHGIDHAIASYPIVSDAIGYGYEEEGHWFYVLTFPTADATWVYDLTASQNLGRPCWHQRASLDGNGQWHRHRSNCYMNFQNMRVVGDFQNGQLYQMSRAFYSDAGNTLKAVRRAPHIWRKENRQRLFHSSLQLEFTPGVGLQSGQGQDPQAMLRWSDDGGFTYSNEHWCSIGKAGHTKNRAIWRRLGRARDRVYEVSISDPVPRDIIGATLFFEPEA